MGYPQKASAASTGATPMRHKRGAFAKQIHQEISPKNTKGEQHEFHGFCCENIGVHDRRLFKRRTSS
jgi:hypothetical protein